MANIIYEYETESGETVRIQAEPSEQKKYRSGTEEVVVQKVGVKFEAALGTVKAATKGLMRAMKEINPDEVSVEFSIKTEGEAGFFTICRASTEATFKITMTWKHAAQAGGKEA